MATKTQLEANRANARRSSGPKTPAGKARSSMNAVKHGLTAETIVIGDEDPAQFELLRKAFEERFDPQSVIERELVERLAGIFWRIRRIPRLEAAIIEIRRNEISYLDLPKETTSTECDVITALALTDDGRYYNTLGKLTRHEAALMNQLTKTLQMLHFIQGERPAEDATVIEIIADPSKRSGSL
jgi:hypothetical protein